MPRVRRQREVIDRKDISLRLEKLVADKGYTEKARTGALKLFKTALDKGETEVKRRFDSGEERGRGAGETRSFLVDQLVRIVYDFAINHVYPSPNPTSAEQISVVATGGYGRGILAPKSDIDLLFLLPYKVTARVEQSVEFVLYTLWDLGLKVGHATRSLDECLKLSQKDHTIRTALLDARWVWGNQDLFKTFESRYRSEILAGSGPAYVEEKLAERDRRHARMGDTRYVLEPNVKEGKGGQRDLQTLFWITKYLYATDDPGVLADRGIITKKDARAFARAENYLWTVRFHLHFATGRAEERLTFDVQNTIAKRMNYSDRKNASGVERFMKHYFLNAKTVGDMTRIICAVLEDEHKKKRSRLKLPWLQSSKKFRVRDFELVGDRLAFRDPDALTRDPRNILRLFQTAQRFELDIHPLALRMVTNEIKLIDRKFRDDPEANRIFMDMLISSQDPAGALKRMNEAGVLGRFVLDFGRVVAQMQYDMYHVYTVDEHTINAINILSRVEQGFFEEEMPIASQIIHEVIGRRSLYVSVFLHDIAKGRGGDHSELGAEVALRLCPRLGLTDAETETVAWLVRYHLLMSRIAFKRDLGNAKTIADFVDIVQSPERLKLLTVLTAVDIRAVGPGVWNGWKAGLLRALFGAALERLTGAYTAEMRDTRVEKARAALSKRLTGWSEEEISQQLSLGYPDYWLSFETEAQLRHAKLIREAEDSENPILVDTRQDPVHDVTEVTVYAQDHPGLFGDVAGALSLSGASIVAAKVHTLANGMALDTLLIQDSEGRAFDMGGKGRLARIKKRLLAALEGTVEVEKEIDAARAKALPSRTEVFTVQPRVLIDNRASRTHTVIEINGRDRLGFLHDVARALNRLGLQIGTAKISTYGERAVDVFYVKDVFGLKIDNITKLAGIEKTLLAAVEGRPDDDAPKLSEPTPPAPAKPNGKAEGRRTPSRTA